MNKKLTFGLLIILSLIIVGGVIYINPFAETALSDVKHCSGSTTLLSIDQVTKFNSANLGGKDAIRVLSSVNGGGECAVINFNKAEIQSELNANGGSFTVDNSVTGDFTKQSQKQIFTAEYSTSKPIEIVKWDTISSSCSLTNCKNNYPSSFQAVSDYWLFGTCYCFYTEPKGFSGQFKSGSVRQNEVSFCINELNECATIDTVSKQSANIQNKAYIQWNGDLIGNQWNDNPNYDLFYSSVNNAYTLSDKSAYANYITLNTNTMACIKGNACDGGQVILWYLDGLITKSNTYNDAVNNLFIDKTSAYVSNEPYVKSVVMSGNQFTVALKTPLTFPTFTIDLDASFVGIWENTCGNFNLACPSTTLTGNSGETKTISLTINNPSTTTCNLGLNLECNNGGSAGLSAYRTTVNPNSNSKVDGYLSLISTSGTKTSTCTFTAYDIKDQSKSRTCSFDYKATALVGCGVANTKVCSPDASELWTCQASGQYAKQVCTYGCSILSGIPQCSQTTAEVCDDGIDNDKDGYADCKDSDCSGFTACINICPAWFSLGGVTIIPNLWCVIDEAVKSVILPIAIILGVLVGLIAYLLLRRISKELRLKQDVINTIILIVISLSLTALFIYIAYQLWWAVLIALIILFVIKVILR